MGTIHLNVRVLGYGLVFILLLTLSAGGAAASREETKERPIAKPTTEESKDDDEQKDVAATEGEKKAETGTEPTVNTLEDLYASPTSAAQLLLQAKPEPEKGSSEADKQPAAADDVQWREVD